MVPGTGPESISSLVTSDGLSPCLTRLLLPTLLGFVCFEMVSGLSCWLRACYVIIPVLFPH